MHYVIIKSGKELDISRLNDTNFGKKTTNSRGSSSCARNRLIPVSHTSYAGWLCCGPLWSRTENNTDVVNSIEQTALLLTCSNRL